MTTPHDPDTPLTLDAPDPFTCEGDCRGCGARSAHLNRWDLCRACVADAGHQTLHPAPA